MELRRARRRRRAGSPAGGGILAVVLAVVASAAGAALAAAGTTGGAVTGPAGFEPSGVEGGGFVNVVAVDPRRTGVVVAGGDVSGLHRSTDWGRSWSVADTGLATTAELKVAAVAFAPSAADTVYAAAGSGIGTGGGFLRSDDGGRSWAVVSRVPQFSGGNNAAPLPSPHPRSTGALLAADPQTPGLVYAATFHDGVMRSTDGGGSWQTLGLAGTYLRGLVLDPADPDVLYAATFDSGVYRTAAASTSGAFTHLDAGPPSVEELAVVGSDLYAAAGPAGLFRSPDAGATWAALATGTSGGTWAAIAGADTVTGRVLYAAAAAPATGGGGRVEVVRSDDGGATWSVLAPAAGRVHSNEIGAAGGPPWWLVSVAADSMLGGARYVAAQLTLDPGDPTRVFLAGRAGLWGSTDSGRDWYPLVGGLQVTINRDVAVDPARPGRAYLADADWELLCSTDALEHVRRCLDVRGTTPLGLAVDASVAPTVVYAAVGNPDKNAKGEVYSGADPAGGGAWHSEGLGKKTNGRRPLAVAADRDNGAPVVLAAVEQSGLWRKAGGVWTRVSSVALAKRQPSGAAAFAWRPGSASVFLYDNATGVWRSSDRGRTWTLIWAKPTTPGGWGHLAADPADPSRLFVSVPGEGLYRLDGVAGGTVGNGVTATEVGSFAAPGPLAFAPGGALLATESAGPPGGPALRRSTDGGASWDVIGGPGYAGAARLPLGLAVDSEGTVLVALRGTGALIGPAVSPG